MKTIFSDTDIRMFKYVLITVILVLLEVVGFVAFTEYSGIKKCEAQYHESCSLIAIPTSIKDLTDDR